MSALTGITGCCLPGTFSEDKAIRDHHPSNAVTTVHARGYFACGKETCKSGFPVLSNCYPSVAGLDMGIDAMNDFLGVF